MRKTILALVAVAALSASVSACEGDSGSTPRDTTSEAVSASQSATQDTLSITPDEGDSLTPQEMDCKEAMRPYVDDAVLSGAMGVKPGGIGPDAVLACSPLDVSRIQELWVDVVREDFGDDVADGVASAVGQ